MADVGNNPNISSIVGAKVGSTGKVDGKKNASAIEALGGLISGAGEQTASGSAIGTISAFNAK